MHIYLLERASFYPSKSIRLRSTQTHGIVSFGTAGWKLVSADVIPHKPLPLFDLAKILFTVITAPHSSPVFQEFICFSKVIWSNYKIPIQRHPPDGYCTCSSSFCPCNNSTPTWRSAWTLQNLSRNQQIPSHPSMNEHIIEQDVLLLLL